MIFLMYLNLQSVTVLNLNPGMEDPQRVLIWAAFHVMPKLVGTLMLAGIMAAGLSSASTFLSVIGFSITSDIVFEMCIRDRRLTEAGVPASEVVPFIEAYTSEHANSTETTTLVAVSYTHLRLSHTD